MDKREEIVKFAIDTELVETCVRYRTNKSTDNYLKDDLTQEVYLWLMTYDIDKLTDAYEKGHLSALITRFICNQWHSKTSPFYKTYRKFDISSDEITAKELNIADPTTEEK